MRRPTHLAVLPFGGPPICASGAGSRDEGTQVKDMTETERLAVVTIARSIRDL